MGGYGESQEVDEGVCVEEVGWKQLVWGKELCVYFHSRPAAAPWGTRSLFDSKITGLGPGRKPLKFSGKKPVHSISDILGIVCLSSLLDDPKGTFDAVG